MAYKGLQFRNEGSKTVEIDVEGVIGESYWWEDDDKDSKNTKEKMKAELKRIAEIKAETIIVNINSYGGDVNHGLSIHDLLAENTAKIITKINGMTASAATIIAMAGDERKISDNSLFLVHRASMLSWGNVNDINEAKDALEKIDARIANIYAKVTGKSKDEVMEIMNRNNGQGEWIDGEEAKNFGFVTEIFEPKKMAAFFNNDILSRYGLPSIPNSTKKQQPQINDESFINRVIDGISKKINFKNKEYMKQFTNINAILGVEKLESVDNEVSMGEDFLTKIENALQKGKDDLKAANDAKTKAEAEKKTAEDNLTNAETALNVIDESVEKSEGIDKKVEAVKVVVAAKPAQGATGTQTKGDGGNNADGSDWDVINSLPHNKEFDENN